ncbi:MAG: 7-cyano-7-deazaguanine synthase [Pirellulales bacterium]|nr:7-cyano-7-deazaguanine synthase [Pirellulales bacterium]
MFSRFCNVMVSQQDTTRRAGLLLSGGLDSAILLAELLKQGYQVQPFYVCTGCQWESAERRAVDRFVAALEGLAVKPVVELQMPVADLYGAHWSTTGQSVPDETTPDEAVSLLGRNPLLLLKAALWCQRHGIPRLAIATLASNPFADNSAEFFQHFEQMLETATGSLLKILRPFAALSKQDVIALGNGLPLELTFSCLAPENDQHCGKCNKCAERARAFDCLPERDSTIYVHSASVTSSRS